MKKKTIKRVLISISLALILSLIGLVNVKHKYVIDSIHLGVRKYYIDWTEVGMLFMSEHTNSGDFGVLSSSYNEEKNQLLFTIYRYQEKIKDTILIDNLSKKEIRYEGVDIGEFKEIDKNELLEEFSSYRLINYNLVKKYYYLFILALIGLVILNVFLYKREIKMIVNHDF